jgi:thymidylate synthase ThyX
VGTIEPCGYFRMEERVKIRILERHRHAAHKNFPARYVHATRPLFCFYEGLFSIGSRS